MNFRDTISKMIRMWSICIVAKTLLRILGKEKFIFYFKAKSILLKQIPRVNS